MKALGLCTPGVVSTIINITPVLILPFVILLYHEESQSAGGPRSDRLRPGSCTLDVE